MKLRLTQTVPQLDWPGWGRIDMVEAERLYGMPKDHKPIRCSGCPKVGVRWSQRRGWYSVRHLCRCCGCGITGYVCGDQGVAELAAKCKCPRAK